MLPVSRSTMVSPRIASITRRLPSGESCRAIIGRAGVVTPPGLTRHATPRRGVREPTCRVQSSALPGASLITRAYSPLSRPSALDATSSALVGVGRTAPAESVRTGLGDTCGAVLEQDRSSMASAAPSAARRRHRHMDLSELASPAAGAGGSVRQRTCLLTATTRCRR